MLLRPREGTRRLDSRPGKACGGRTSGTSTKDKTLQARRVTQSQQQHDAGISNHGRHELENQTSKVRGRVSFDYLRGLCKRAKGAIMDLLGIARIFFSVVLARR